MIHAFHVRSRLHAILGVMALGVLAGCSADAGDVLTPPTVTLEAPQNGGGGGSSIEVTHTVPDKLARGSQGVGLTVRGSGFQSDSELGFELDGVETDGVVVESVAYVDQGGRALAARRPSVAELPVVRDDGPVEGVR